MNEEIRHVLAALTARLDRDKLEVESSLIAQRELLAELLARQFEGQLPTFDALISECMEAARSIAAEPGRSEEARQELAAQIAARLAVIGQRVRNTL